MDSCFYSNDSAMCDTICAIRYTKHASVAELADAPGLGPGVRYGRGGSSPLARSFQLHKFGEKVQ